MRNPRVCADCHLNADPSALLTPGQREELRLTTLLKTFPQYTTDVDGDYETLGVVTGTAVMGANMFRDIFAGLTDIVGGRSGSYQNVLARGRDIALAEMCDEAQKRGADLVAGIRLDTETMNNMLIVSASGTALKSRS